MKLLDRYILSIFGSAFALVTLTFVTLFTVMDLSSRIARILSLKSINTLPFLAEYYGVRLPMFLHLVLPAVSLFAAMFSVIQLQKTNELLPMVVSGVSVRRLSMTFVASAFICALMMGILDEFVLPNLAEKIGETDDILISDKPLKGQFLIDRDLAFYMNEYERLPRVMKDLTLTCWKNNQRERVIRAATATWDRGKEQWVLRAGTMTPYNADGTPEMHESPGQRPRVREDPLPAEGVTLEKLGIKTDLKPESFKKKFSLSGRSYRLAELIDLMEKYPHIPAFQMYFHGKFASPLGAVVLLFLGLPLVTGAQHRSYYRGVGLCLLLTIAYYAATFVCFETGIRGAGLSPAVAVWSPIVVFGLVGLAGFLRMRS